MKPADDAFLRGEGGAGRGGSRLLRIFGEALDTPLPQRRSFVAAACAGDAALETRVLELLAAHEDDRGPLDVPLSRLIGPLLDDDADRGADRDAGGDGTEDGQRAAGAGSANDTVPGARVGPYRIVRLIARGGMGSVYLAERADGAYEQQVALKVVNAEVLSEELERRFLRERQILARLDHPGIARLLHGGLTPGGHPYLAMELVDGEPITSWAAESGAGTRAIVEIFLQVCDAVHYAHGRLVVHRDLKPSNILVAPDGRARLLDFGIARLLAVDPDDGPQTRTGLLLLTPEYAAPELLLGEPVTTSTDVYALGVVLHEALTGRRPFAERTRSLGDLVRLSEREPPAPSRAPGLDPTRRRELEGDLDAVIGMALRREPARRYPSVESLADDLRAHLARRPVLARPDTRRYRVGRFVRRNAVGVSVSAALMLSVVAGLIGTSLMAASARREAARSEAVRAFLFSLWEGADPARHGGSVPSVLELVDRGMLLVDSLSEDAGVDVRVDMLTTLGFLNSKLGEYDRAVGVFERAVDDARDGLGPHERTAAALDGLAQNLVWSGRSDEAEAPARESAAMREAVGSPAPALAGSYSTLGATLMDLGRYEEGRRAHLRALELDREATGPTSETVAVDLNNLGFVSRVLGEYEEAERYLRESVRVHRAVPGDLSGLATSLGNLGGVRRDLGDVEEAESLEREALELRRRVLGPDHPDVTISLNQLSLTLQAAGRLVESDSLQSLSNEIRARVLGPDHPETIAGLNNQATVRYRRGDYAGAARAQEAVVTAARATDADLVSATTITMVHNLGVMKLAAADLTGAEGALTEALQARRSVLGADHVDVAVSLRWISELRRRQGRFSDAVTLGREALTRFEAALPPGHRRIAEAQLSVGSALVELERATDALPLLRSALEARASSLPEDDLQVAEARARLGTALARTGVAEEARALLESAVRAYDAAERADDDEAVRAREELRRIS